MQRFTRRCGTLTLLLVERSAGLALFFSLNDGFLRKNSVKDGGAFLDWLRSHPRVDGNRIVVSGGSYGGYMSLAMAVDYGEKLRDAIETGYAHARVSASR